MAQSVSRTVTIDAPIQELYDIVTDIEAYPEWVDGVQHVEVLERNEDGLVHSSRWRVDVQIRVVEYDLEYAYDAPNVLEWTSLPGGDVKLVEGRYTFAPADDGGTDVTYELTVDPGFPVPGFLLKAATGTVISRALDGLAARVAAV